MNQNSFVETDQKKEIQKPITSNLSSKIEEHTYNNFDNAYGDDNEEEMEED